MRALTFPGKPCPKGHTERYLAGGQCVQCSKAHAPSMTKEERAVYAKRYRETRKRLGRPLPDR
jgi:hypothetical protein